MSTFRNGEPIPEAKNAKQWAEAREKRTAAFCYYDFDSNNGKVYGKLYNWFAVNDSRGLAPKGYHIPSDAEWTILRDKLGGEENLGKKMKSTSGWKNNGNGNNISGFNGMPGGYCNDYGEFDLIGAGGSFWSSSEDNSRYAYFFLLHCDYTKGGMSYGNKSGGTSVRCLRD